MKAWVYRTSERFGKQPEPPCLNAYPADCGPVDVLGDVRWFVDVLDLAELLVLASQPEPLILSPANPDDPFDARIEIYDDYRE